MRYLFPFLLVLAVLLMAGCSGISSLLGVGAGNFQGSYIGTFSNSNGQTGAIALSVASTGIITGTSVNVTSAATSPVTGTINSIGAATLVTAIGTGSGSLAFNQSNQLTGTLQISGGAGGTVTITASPAQGGSTFAGSFSGTFTNSAGQTGTMTFIIDSSGNITGLVSNSTVNSTNTLLGTINLAGFMTITANNGGGTDTGTLVLNGSGNLTGTLNNGQGLTINITVSQNLNLTPSIKQRSSH